MTDDKKGAAGPPAKSTGHRFQKGQSGNPSGKAKIIQALDANGEVTELYRLNAGPVFVKLMQIIHSSKTPPNVAVAAIREFNDRAFGKPPKTLTTRVQEVEDDLDISLLPLEAQAQIVALKKERDAEGD